MFDQESIYWALGLIVVSTPCVMAVLFGIMSLLDRPLSEACAHRLVQLTLLPGCAALLGLLGCMLHDDTQHVSLDLGAWVHIPDYHFSVKFVFDRLSVPMALLSFILCGTIGIFASKYMHREPGYNRFFTLFAFFTLGMIVTSLAGTIETLFTGWELVGLSSAFLVAFFHERPAPVRNALRVWIVYRVSDAALLLAAVVLHHMRGAGDLDRLLGSASWPDGQTNIPANEALIVGVLFVIAAAGKSALVPFSGWLPRAMEGPTPSSAVFYGALSVHLGAYLLLRISPLIEITPALAVLVVGIGLSTAIFASLAGRVQTDIKSALSFASLAQVGLIVAEIGLGFRYLALIHLLGHASWRTLQLVRAPSLLHDYRNLENAIGQRLPPVTGPWERWLSPRQNTFIYRFALERGYLDVLLNDWIVRPFVGFFRRCDRLEQRWTTWLSGATETEQPKVTR
jgi:NADH-quinone oxidoreductase subunit L